MKYVCLALILSLNANATMTATQATKATERADAERKADYARMQKERDEEFPPQVDLDIKAGVEVGDCSTSTWSYGVSQDVLDKETTKLTKLGYHVTSDVTTMVGVLRRYESVLISWCPSKK